MAENTQPADGTGKSLVPGNSSYEELLTPPPKRGWGIKIDMFLFIWIIVVVFSGVGMYFLSDVNVTQSLLGDIGNRKLFGFSLYLLVASLLPLSAMLGMVFTAPAFASIWITRWHYPRISKTISLIPDRRNNEGINRILPILSIDRRKYAIVSCPRSGQLWGPPLAMAVINEKGSPVTNDKLFERALETYDFGTATIRLQGYYGLQLRNLKKEIDKQVARVRAILKRNRSQFEAQQVGLFGQQAETGLDIIEAAFRERERYLNALFDYFKAAGYGFVNEYYHEDALRRRSLDIAFAAEMESKYQLPAQVTVAAAAALLEQIKTNPKGWHRRRELIKGLNYLDEARKVIEQWIYIENVQRHKETQMLRDCYHKKLDNLRARRIPVVSE